MQLYSGPLSLFTAKVRIALDEKDIDYERIEVGWSLASRYEPHHPEVARRNPKKQVPVLVDCERGRGGAVSGAAGRPRCGATRARAQLASHYAWLDAELGDRTWFCGDAFTFADVALFVMIRAASGLGAGPAAERRDSRRGTTVRSLGPPCSARSTR